MRRFVTGLLILVSAIALLLSSVSLWTRHNVINTSVFVSNVQAMVDLPPVEARVTDRVTSTVMTNPQVQSTIDDAVTVLPPRLQRFRPTVEDGIQSLVSKGVARLLTADPFRSLTAAALTSMHTQLVNGQPVRFTLGQAKARVPASLTGGLAGQVLALLPNDVGVTLLTPADAPKLYTAVDLLKSVWWWLGLLGLATLAGALSVSRRRRSTLRAWAVTTAVLGLLVLLTLRVARGLVLPQAKPENRDAVGAIYDLLANSLRSWTLWFVAAALVVLVFTVAWGRLGVVAGIRRAARAARERVRQMRAAQAAEAEAVGADGAVATTAPDAAADSWPRRVAAATGAFVDGLALRAWTARLGGFVRAYYRPARWTGITVAALVLLSWSAPTLSVLIWIVALAALYLVALDWLQSQAPSQVIDEAVAQAVDEAVAVEEVRAATTPPAGPIAGIAERGAAPVVPTARQSTDGTPAGRGKPEAAPAPQTPEVPAPETIAVLNDRLELLMRLSTAHDSGVLTDEEFDREKSRLLSV
jgi:hypothetical protein